MDNESDITKEVAKAISYLDYLVDNNYYYLYQTLLDKQELSTQYDSQTVDDICELAEQEINKYLSENNLFGFCDNGYREVIVAG